MHVYVGVATLCVCSALHAAPLAQIERDIDGDGAIDRVSVESTGELIIQGSRRTVLALRPSLAHAAITAAMVGGVPTLVVTTAANSDERTNLFVLDQSGWRDLANVSTGPVGSDGEYAVALTADASGIYRYQTRPGLRRCDDKPGYLFAEGWNGTRFQRLSKIPTGVPPNAPVIASRVEASASPAPLVYQARVASHQPGADTAAALAIPTEISDGKPSTFWYEEFANSAGEGQFFTFEPRLANARASRVRIVPGKPTASGSPRAFNRPRRIAIVGASGAWRVDLPDAATAPSGTAYVADLPTPIAGCVTIVLESTYGPANGRTAIAELAVLAEAERAASGGGEAALAQLIREGQDGVNAAAQALAQRGSAAVTAIDQELRRAADAQARHRLARALVAISDPSAGPAITRAILAGAVHERDIDQAVRTLATMGFTAQLRDIAAHGPLAVGARVVAARALAGNEVIIDLAGNGPYPLRQAVVEAMSPIGVAKLVTAASNAPCPAAAGDLWRAVTRRAIAATAERSRAVEAMLAALQSASNYECQYRLVEGVASVGDTTALGVLQHHISQMPPDAARRAFQVIAASAIGRHPRVEASTLLLWLAREPDAGVRTAALTAISAMHPNATRPEMSRTMEVALRDDVWPEVRRVAARGFAARCEHPQLASILTQSVRRDPDVGVRNDALGTLVQCKAAGTGTLLVNVWNDQRLPIALRTTAIDLSVVLEDSAAAARLVSAFEKWQRHATDSTTALALAQSAAQALGRLAPPGAVDALGRVLADTHAPDVVAAAAAALGAMGPRCTEAAKQQLQSLVHADDQQVRIAAAQAVLQCGNSPTGLDNSGNARVRSADEQGVRR